MKNLKKEKDQKLFILGTIGIIVSTIVVLFSIATGHYQKTSFMHSYTLENASNWTLELPNGEKEIFSDFPKSISLKKGQTFTLTTTLPQKFSGHYGIMLYTNYCRITVTAAGQELNSYAKTQPLPVGKLVGNVRLLTELPREAAGEKLTLSFTPFYSSNGSINPILFGDVHALKLSVVYDNMWRVYISVFSLTIALICFGIFFHHLVQQKSRHDYTFYHLGAFLCCLCLWLLCSSDVPQMYTSANEAISLLSFFSLFLIIIHLAGYCGAVLENKERLFQIMQYVGWGLLLLEAIGFITNLWDPPQMLIFHHLYIMVVILTAMHYSFKQRKQGTEEKTLFAAVTLFLISAASSLIAFYFNPTGGLDAVFLGIGILFFASLLFAMLLLREVKYLEERRKMELYRELAYTDVPTGLENRSAFDMKMEEIQDLGTPQTLVQLAILDLNHLKRVNDEIGHYAGDEMIIGTADCIKKAFSDYGNVYRIGGDEYAAVLMDQPEQMEACIQMFEKEIEKYNEYHTEIPLSVAKGYEERLWNDHMHFTRDLFRDADQKMYDDKQLCHAREDRKESV